MVNEEYVPFSDGWYPDWASDCHLTEQAWYLEIGDRVQPNFKDPALFDDAPTGEIDAIYEEGGTRYATVVWDSAGSAEIPLLALTEAAD